MKTISDVIDGIKDYEKYLEKLRWPDGIIISPFDKGSKVYHCTHGQFKCKNTGKYFNVRTGTIFENTKIPLKKWFLAFFLQANHKKGISSYQLARDIGVTQKTAWFMLHRIRWSQNNKTFNTPLAGTIETDETFIGGKNRNRHYSKRIKYGSDSKGKWIDKTAVLGVLSREQGRVAAFVVPDVSINSIYPVIKKSVVEGSKVYSDEHVGYFSLHYKYKHETVIHSKYEYVKGDVHTNGIEGFWSHVKRSIIGIYHHISRKYTQMYLYEFCFKHNTRKMTSEERLKLLFSNIEVRLKHKTLVYGEL